jgi:hypothetical protein
MYVISLWSPWPGPRHRDTTNTIITIMIIITTTIATIAIITIFIVQESVTPARAPST